MGHQAAWRSCLGAGPCEITLCYKWLSSGAAAANCDCFRLGAHACVWRHLRCAHACVYARCAVQLAGSTVIPDSRGCQMVLRSQTANSEHATSDADSAHTTGSVGLGLGGLLQEGVCRQSNTYVACQYCTSCCAVADISVCSRLVSKHAAH